LIRFTYFLLISILFLSSCSEQYHPISIDFFQNDTIPFRDKLQKALEPEYLKELGFSEEQAIWLQDYYEKKSYKSLWVNDSMISREGLKLRHVMKRSLWFGIPTNRLIQKVEKRNKLWIEEEILLTAQLSSMFNDLRNGFIDYKLKQYKPIDFIDFESLDSLLNQRDTLTMEKIILNQGIKDSNYRFLANKIYGYCLNHGIDNTDLKVNKEKDDSSGAVTMARKSLILKKYLSENDTTYVSYDRALKEFQKDNGLKQDGIIGEYTAKALSESNLHKVMRAALTLDKIRSRNPYPEKYVGINIPEYVLRLVIKDTLRAIHRVIVGKPDHKTPELSSRIHEIVVFPYWNVPYSIAGKEVLPSVKANPSYLSNNHYKIFKGDNEVNPYSVHWSRIRENTFPYKLVQQPGPHNSLGILKFEFYSNYSVYLHDTPSKYLFSKDIRAFSHGCMRCQYPDSLAKALLNYDSVRTKRNSITAPMLDSLLSLKENYRIKIMDPVPVFVEYRTVYADRTALIFYPDIYFRDEQYLKVMNE
jgi:hypothetical protein